MIPLSALLAPHPQPQLLLESAPTDSIPYLTPSELTLLTSHSITSLHSLLFLPPHSIPLSFYRTSQLKSLLPSHLLPPHSTASSLLKLQLPQSDSIEFPLFPHLSANGIIELTGSVNSHNSLYSLHLSLIYLLTNPTKQVLIIDTQNAFDPSLCLSIAKSLITNFIKEGRLAFTEDGEGGDGEEGLAMELLEKVGVVKCWDISGVLEAVEGGTNNDETGLVVIDQLNTVLGEKGDEESTRNQASIVEFMRRLTLFSKSSEIPIIILTRTTSSKPPKPALGQSLTYLTDLTLAFTLLDEKNGKGVVEILRNRSGESRYGKRFVSMDGIELRELI